MLYTDSPILQALYTEYQELKDKMHDLNDKLIGVEELITKYGGSIPLYSPSLITFDFSKVNAYPYSGTWKEKIFFALKLLKKPSTANEIAKFLVDWEPEKSELELVNTVTQYCSSMASGDKNTAEINADKTGYRNKYFLKQ